MKEFDRPSVFFSGVDLESVCVVGGPINGCEWGDGYNNNCKYGSDECNDCGFGSEDIYPAN